MKDKKIPEIIDKYSDLIKINLKSRNTMNEKDIEDINNKIYDYIMDQLYDKLFPKEQDKNDFQIFQNCYKHIWIELTNLIKQNKNYIFDNYLPDSINCLQQFEKEKSPRKKLIYIKQLFNCIYNLGLFNGTDVEGADDEMPLLNYTFIKARPKNIYSNCKYTELFLGKKQFGIEGNQLTNLFGVCEKMTNFSFEDLFNINSSDYNLNCSLVSKEILF